MNLTVDEFANLAEWMIAPVAGAELSDAAQEFFALLNADCAMLYPPGYGVPDRPEGPIPVLDPSWITLPLPIVPPMPACGIEWPKSSIPDTGVYALASDGTDSEVFYHPSDLPDWKPRSEEIYCPTNPFKNPGSGWVYLLEVAVFNPDIKKWERLWKIGKSEKPCARISSLEVRLPYDVFPEHIIVTNDRHLFEARLHYLFRNERVRGEWFRLQAVDVAAIKSMQVPVEITRRKAA